MVIAYKVKTGQKVLMRNHSSLSTGLNFTTRKAIKTINS